MKVTGAGYSDIGLRRHMNEDSFAMAQEGGEAERRGACYVVCDGLGGAPAGEVASRLAADAFVAAWLSGILPSADMKQRSRHAVREADDAVRRASWSSADLAGMGTTLVALVTYAGRACICNVGDSRCYRLRAGVLRQLTEDHTLAADMVRQGLLDPAYAREVSERNILTRAVGTAGRAEPDIAWDEMHAGDRYLLCTDGLWGPVPEPDLGAALTNGSVQEAARRLVELANAHGGPDNATAVVVEITEPGGSSRECLED